MDKQIELIQEILMLDNRLQRQIYAGWPNSWVQARWPVGSVRALLLIENGNAHTPSEVAAVLKVNRTTVTGILDRLEAENLITRKIDANDRRCFILELTDAGRELVHQIDAMRQDQLERGLNDMDVADLQALHQGLQALTQAMKAAQDKSEARKEEKISK